MVAADHLVVRAASGSETASAQQQQPLADMPRAEASTPAFTRKAVKEHSLAVADKLIGIFSERKPEEWRKLMVYSKDWARWSDVVFDR